MRKRRMKNSFPELDEKGYGLKLYGFDGKQISMGQWTTMTEERTQAVGATWVRGQGKVYRVSTVLLGIDYSFGQDGRPLIFETMVFEQGPNGILEIMGRYSTIQQARKGHRHVVRGMRQMLANHGRLYPPMLHNGRKS